MRLLLTLLSTAALSFGLSNKVTLTVPGGGSNQPVTISRIFALGEITGCAQPLVDGSAATSWQCNDLTRWGDGSLKHAIVSIPATSLSAGTHTIAFRNSTSYCHLGTKVTCEAAALTKAQALAFNSSGWGAKITATANPQGATTATSVSARTILTADGYTYWLKGPVMTQFIVEDASTARAYDFGWKESRVTQVNTFTGTGTGTFQVLDATDVATLTTPFNILIESEEITITNVTGVIGGVLTMSARGVNGTSAAQHGPGALNNPVFSNPLTTIPSGLSPTAGSMTVADASGISDGDVLIMGYEHARVCGKSGTTVYFNASGTGCSSGDVNGRGWDGTTAASHGGHCYVWKASATDRWSNAATVFHKGLHPIFVLTFYPGYTGVKEEFIVENMWSDRLQDQEYNAALFNGGSETTSVYTRTAIHHIPLTRWRETFWDGATQASIRVDYNLEYMNYTGVVAQDPQVTLNTSGVNRWYYDPQSTQAGYAPGWEDSTTCAPTNLADLNKAPFTVNISTGGTATINPVSDGQIVKDIPVVGGRPDIGIMPGWYGAYLASMNSAVTDADKVYSLLSNGECAAHIPIHYRDATTGLKYCGDNGLNSSTGSCTGSNALVDTFSKPWSLDAHPTTVTIYATSPGDAGAADRVHPTGPYSANHWIMDAGTTGHYPSLSFLPYIITGDWYYLSEVQYAATWMPQFGSQGNPYYSVTSDITTRWKQRHYDWAYCGASDGERSNSWCMRDQMNAAYASVDGTAEAEYHRKKWQIGVAIQEGRFNVTNGTYYNNCFTGSNYDCSPWVFGRHYKGMGQPNLLSLTVPLGGWDGNLAGGDPCGDITLALNCEATFMRNYTYQMFGMAARMGMTEADPTRQVLLLAFAHSLKDPGVLNPFSDDRDYTPGIPCLPEATPVFGGCTTQVADVDHQIFFTTWANWWNAHPSAYRTKAAYSSDTDKVNGYASIFHQTAAFMTDLKDAIVSGTSAWDWIDGNIRYKFDFAQWPAMNFSPPVKIVANVIPGTTSIVFKGSTSTGQPVRIAISTTPFTVIDDASDTAATMVGHSYSLTISASSGTSYYYRVSSGAGRTSGTVTTH